VRHSELVGLSDNRLRVLAPDATHQHFKGGLYRFLGKAMGSDTGRQMRNEHGELLVAYMHCYPYEKQVWLRPESEWSSVVDGRDGFVVPRFRPIEGTVQS
jgi:hypothetical protein